VTKATANGGPKANNGKMQRLVHHEYILPDHGKTKKNNNNNSLILKYHKKSLRKKFTKKYTIFKIKKRLKYKVHKK